MRINDVIRGKGAQVVTVTPGTLVRQLLRVLAEHNIGAAVVSTDRSTIEGIVSERDIVRHLTTSGIEILEGPVSSIMTEQVHTCTPADTVDELMRLMTERRIRHVPVLVDGKIAGLVSIGDVVKTRIGELEFEREELEKYIAQTR
ncbi:CBS domain-containing protein [Actinopolymorpha alba]|uniref:CBS domain-containing protein n=1 Tax=Actinopolymorpha alba TaxID=533267 RepID=UPI0003753797|nr:CBS domain-containing protein [Actinopolymorpha alba]